EVLSDRLTVWEARLTNPKESQFVYVAEIEDTFVAFVCGYLDEDSEYGTLIDNLHVNSKFIGQRIGEKLMVGAARLLEEKNKTSMYLWVLTSNTKAINFYERLGGIPVETVNDFEIGDREVTKTRYYWPSLNLILGLHNKKKTNER
ncbi:N-acetyltransferase, partial [uncultured Paraglaciecola sp.]|uniref:GNAT family N-acetyltransferase n=1 Tax=uncultured Paraglaciecola sp. TaxID=1765024 RepID=UPI00260A0159